MLRFATRVLASCVVAAAVALPAAAATVAEAAAVPVAAGPADVRDLARAFDDFWQRTQQQGEAERIAAFKREIVPLFPDFYGIERYQGRRTQAQQDAVIGKALASYAAIRSDYLQKARQFERDLPRYSASFLAAFPDYRQRQPIYFLHSFYEMDGGTRELNGHAYLIFGIDGMVRYHGAMDEGAFFHHELFHTYHGAALDACDSDTVWVRLWSEGLATYVSHVLNPGADEKALLLDMPEGLARRTRQVLPAALAQLESVVDSTASSDAAGLFSIGGGDSTGLPARRGYYLGYLVAQEAARTRSLQQLAKLDCKASRDVVIGALHQLNAMSASAGK